MRGDKYILTRGLYKYTGTLKFLCSLVVSGHIVFVRQPRNIEVNSSKSTLERSSDERFKNGTAKLFDRIKKTKPIARIRPIRECGKMRKLETLKSLRCRPVSIEKSYAWIIAER